MFNVSYRASHSRTGSIALFLLLITAFIAFASCKKEPPVQRVVAILPASAIPVERPLSPQKRDTESDAIFSSRFSQWKDAENAQVWTMANTHLARSAITTGLMEHKLKPNFRIVDTSFIDQILEQHNFEGGEWSDANKVAEIGRALNADIVVIATVMPVAANVVISINFLEINSMEVLGKADVVMQNGFFSGLPNIVKKLPPAVKKIKINI